MAKFRLNPDSVFEIDDGEVPCPTSISFDESVDTYISECAGATTKEHVLGSIVVTGSFSGEVDNNEVLGAVEPGTAGELLLQPYDTTPGNLQITSDNIQITSRSLALSSTGLTTYTCNFVCDDLTIAAIPTPP
jgi:hypothetical protein